MSKVLVVGPVLGKFKKLVSFLQKSNQKNGPFDLVLCLGDLFGEETPEELEELLADKLTIPVQCYCVMGGSALPAKVIDKVERNHGEITPNLVFLGKQAVYTLSSGIRIAAFGGQFDLDQFTAAEMDNARHPLSSPYITASSVASFLVSLNPPPKAGMGSLAAASASGPAPIDILVTHAWPSQVTHESGKPPVDPEASNWGVPVLSEILSAVKPRYHFTSEQPVFWEREPFEYPGHPNNRSYTRFLSLGSFSNKEKERWFYAFNIAPCLPGAQPRPVNVTSCPLSLAATSKFEVPGRGQKRGYGQTLQDETPPDYIFGGAGRGKAKPPPPTYVCNICSESGHWIQDCPQAGSSRGKKRERKEITPGECWFCLSNPKVTKHLIASIGNECYVTLPKGQVPNTQDGSSPVPGGGHVLIIPIGHYPTMRAIPAEQAESVTNEVELYKKALKKCYAQYGASMVTFEVGRYSGKGGHAHVQVCPIPNGLADKAAMAFMEEGAREGYEFETDEDILDTQNITENYFRVELPDGRKMVHLLKPGRPFNLQFGRVTVANLLAVPDRADWKVCARSDDEEKAEATAFKGAFGKFDDVA